MGPYRREIECVTVGYLLLTHLRSSVMLMTSVGVLTEDANRDLLTPKLLYHLELVFVGLIPLTTDLTQEIFIWVFCRIYIGRDLFNHFLNIKFSLVNKDSNYEIHI